MISYKAVDKKSRKNVLDDKVERGMFERANHYSVLANMEITSVDGSGRIIVKEVNYVLV